MELLSVEPLNRGIRYHTYPAEIELQEPVSDIVKDVRPDDNVERIIDFPRKMHPDLFHGWARAKETYKAFARIRDLF